MSLKNLISAFAATVMLISSASMSAQSHYGSNPGVLISGSCDVSTLPQAAKKFLEKHFHDVNVKECEHEYLDAIYKVKLVNGVELEFANDGSVVEIEAAKRQTLQENIVKDVVPGKIYKHLKEKGLADDVESIEYEKGKVIEVDVAIKGPDTFMYDLDGNFLIIKD